MANGSGLQNLWGKGGDPRDGGEIPKIEVSPGARPANYDGDTWRKRVEFAERLRQSARPPSMQTPQTRKTVFGGGTGTPGAPGTDPGRNGVPVAAVDAPHLRAAGLRSNAVTSPHRATLPPPPSAEEPPSTKRPAKFPPEEPSSAHDHAKRASAIMEEARARIGLSGPLSAVRGGVCDGPVSTANVDGRLAAIRGTSDVRALLAMDPGLADLDAETQGTLVTVIAQLVTEARIGSQEDFSDQLDKIKKAASGNRIEGDTFLMVELAQWLKGQVFVVENAVYTVSYVSFKDLLSPIPPKISAKSSAGEVTGFTLLEIFSGLKIGA